MKIKQTWRISLVLTLILACSGQAALGGGSDSRALLERGLALYHQGKLNDARISIEGSLKQKARPEGFYYLGQIYLTMDRPILAERNFVKFLEISDDSARKQEVREILSGLQEGSSFTDKASEHLGRGRELLGSGQHDLAVLELEKALKLDPGLADAHFYLGEIYMHREEYDRAIDEYQKASRGYR